MAQKETNSKYADIKELLESNEIVEAISTAKSMVEPLLTVSDINEYSDDSKAFIDLGLPFIFKDLFNLEKQPRKIIFRIVDFIKDYIELIVKLNFHEKMLKELRDSLHNYDKPIRKIAPVQLSKEDVKNIKDSFGNNNATILYEDDSTISPLIKETIKICFTSKLFPKSLEFLSPESEIRLTNTQLSLMFNLFYSIEAYLSDDIIFLILPDYTDAVINVLQEDDELKEDLGGHLTQMLTGFYDMLPEKTDRILQLLCSRVFNGPVLNRIVTMNGIIQIVEGRKLTKTNLKLVKETFLNGIFKFSKDELVSKVLGFLPSLSDKTQFDDDDLRNILEKVKHATVFQKCKSISQIIPNMDSSLKKFAKFFLTICNNIYSPELICLIINRVADKEIAQQLFEVLLKPPEGASLSSFDFKLSEKMMRLIEETMSETEDPEIICSLSRIILNSKSQTKNVDVFINKVIAMSESDESLIPILKSYSSLLNTFDSKSTILNLFERAFSHYQSGENVEYLKKVITVLTDWISEVTIIPENQFFERLKEITFTNMPMQMAPLISNIIKKSKKGEPLKELLLKIIEDTVPPRYSSWAIKNVFSYLHGDKKAINGIVDTLISHLQDPNKIENTLHLIKRAAQYEADFFRIGETDFCNKFRISVTGPKNIEFDCSFHPYHSCRRVYAEVSKILRIPVDKFQLSVTDKYQNEDKLIISTTPISEIVEHSVTCVRLNIVLMDTGVTDFYVDPIFLNALYDNIESQKTLYNLLSDTSQFSTSSSEAANIDNANAKANDDESILSSMLIEILQLFEAFMGYEAISPLQRILLRDYDRPLDYANNITLFPAALNAYNQNSMSIEDFSTVINLLINEPFDKLSVTIMSKAITRIECPEFVFSTDQIKKGLIMCGHKSLRAALYSHFNSLNSIDDMILLIPLVIDPLYRESSKEFLMCFKKLNVPGELFVPFFVDLKQFETVNNVDQTFISLLQLIPRNEETVKLTYERVSVAPTMQNPQNPFVHSDKAREAAFRFLTTDQVFPILHAHMKVLPEVPLQQKLQDDFTFKGRNGISNLGSTCYINALMQSLNTVSNFTNRVLSLPTEGLSKYLLELRDCMAQLRFTRTNNISLRPLVDTIPKFDVFQQADTSEFLIQLLNCITDELKDLAEPIKAELEISGDQYICDITHDKVLNKLEEKSFVLTLQTKGLNNLFDSFKKYYEDEPFEEGYRDEETNEKVAAVRRTRITKWPNYLFIQIQRWDFNLENENSKMEIKLVHEFGFPIKFSTHDLHESCRNSENIQYQLTAVIVHEGDVESGHYFALVEDSDSDECCWYKCDDTDIQLFDIANIPSWSFGIPQNDSVKDNKILTAYLLFYRRVDTPVVEPNFPLDLEERINRFNETTWPTSFFYSHQFLNFTKALTSTFRDETAAEIAFTVLFKVAVANDKVAKQWQEHIKSNFVSTPTQCDAFFKFVDTKIGNSLGPIINHSDHAADCLKTIIYTAFEQLPTTTKYMMIILKQLDFLVRTRTLELAFELICLAYQDLMVSWKDEEDVLKIMVQYIALEIKDEYYVNLKFPHKEATDVIVKILSNVVLQKGVIESVSILFQPEVLERLSPILKQSESFQKLATYARSLQPAIISSVGMDSKSDSNSSNLFAPLFYTPTLSSEKSAPVLINANFIGDVLEKLVFSSNKSIRRNTCQILCEVIDRPDPVVENYINNRVFKPDLICPKVVGESTFLDMLASLLPIGLKQLARFDSFADVLEKLCVAAPFATSLSFSLIVDAVPEIEDPAVLVKFLIVVKHLVAFDDSLREKVPPSIVETFLGLEFGSVEALQFVALFRNSSSGSPLFGSCISEALEGYFSDVSNKIINMLEDGMVPGKFIVPEVTKDPMNVLIAASLFMNSEKQRDNLLKYILSILRRLRPVDILKTEPFSGVIKMIEKQYNLVSIDTMLNPQ